MRNKNIGAGFMAGLLLLVSSASAAVDYAVNDLLGNITAPFIIYSGSYTLLGLGIAAALAYLAWAGKLNVPSILFVGALVLAVMATYAFIATEVVIGALIIGGILGGVGVGRWLGIL